MMFQKASIILCLSLLFLGCSPTHSPKTKVSSSEVIQQTQAEQLGQMLPITAHANLSSAVIKLEVARTPEQQAMGLMYRASLPDDQGMLFPFEEARYTRFWMKNVTISLDMIFLKQGIIKAIFSDVPPCTDEPCSTYGPETPIDQVIEIRGGRASELGLQKGDRIKIEFLSSP